MSAYSLENKNNPSKGFEFSFCRRQDENCNNFLLAVLSGFTSRMHCTKYQDKNGSNFVPNSHSCKTYNPYNPMLVRDNSTA